MRIVLLCLEESLSWVETCNMRVGFEMFYCRTVPAYLPTYLPS